jgi:hypothetical protein
MTLISKEYLEQQKELHKNPMYGMASLQYGETVKSTMNEFGLRTLCDYGAGKQRLLTKLKELNADIDAYYPYDPSFPEYGEAKAADLVVCIDVLEHIEPELLDNVLLDLKKLVVKYGLFTVHTGPAGKILADGRNAHLIQQPINWWLDKLRNYFTLGTRQEKGAGFWVIVKPKEEE